VVLRGAGLQQEQGAGKGLHKGGHLYEAQKYAHLKASPPTRINVYEDPEVQQKSRLAKMFAEVDKVGMPARTSLIYMRLKSDLNSIVNKVVLGQLMPEIAAAQMQKLLMEKSKIAGLL
jgi:ABC-type glycerol-3-phosphate transport system substrate-binding protein